MKFSTVARGTRATAPIRVGEQAALVRPLSAGEEMDVVAEAIRRAKARGAPAEPRQPIYEAALMAATLATAVVDADAPAEPFFPGGADDVLTLDPEQLATLYEQQARWQEECSPTFRQRSVTELFAIAKELSEDDGPLVYERLPRTTRRVCMLFMAGLLRSSLASNSPSSSSSEAPTASGRNGAASDKPNVTATSGASEVAS